MYGEGCLVRGEGRSKSRERGREVTWFSGKPPSHLYNLNDAFFTETIDHCIVKYRIY